MRRCVAAADGRDRGRWLEERQKYLTASDVGAVMRTNKWKRPIDVYREKVCGAEEIDNEHIRRGNRLEPVILDAWASGGGVFRGPGTPYRACATLYRSVQYPWLAATPDAFARVEGATVVAFEFFWPLLV